MTKIIIEPKTEEEQNLLTQMLRKMNVEAKIVEEPLPNQETQKAMKDVEMKKGTRMKNSKDLFNKLGI